MTMRRVGVIALLVLIAVLSAVLGLWLYQNLEQRRVEVYIGYGTAAQRNPLYMAEIFLTRLGVKAKSIRSLDQLPNPLAPADTLVMTLPTYILSAAEVQRLLDWVQEGGHWIANVQRDYYPKLDPQEKPPQRGDHLLSRLQVHSATGKELENLPIQLDPSQPPFTVSFDNQRRLNDVRLLAIPMGRGRVTLLPTITPLTNRRLTEYDHADFLAALAHHNRGRGTVWLQYQTLAPSLLQLFWEYAWMPLLGLLLTLWALLWRCSRRFGPLITPQPIAQRRLAEHLRASSHFLWRHEAGALLLQAARQHATRCSERRSPAALSHPLLVEQSDQPLDDQQLLATLQTLQRLSCSR